jgi:hypothetical protein
MDNLRCAAGFLLLGFAMAAHPGTFVYAEVGVITQVQGPTSYILETIVDEPEPIDTAAFWLRHFPDTAHRRVLNEQGHANEDGRPSLLAGAGPGFPIVAWSRNSPAGYDIVISRFDGSNWTAPQVISGAPADELDPHLVLDPIDGSIHVLYWIHDGSPRVMHRQAPTDLSSWSPPSQVSSPGDAACRPTGAFHDGVLHVAYELHDLGYGSAPRQIMLATRDGQTFSSQILTTTQYAAENRPRVHSAGGRIWVDWIDAEGEMTWIRQSQGGSWDPVQIEYFETPEQRDFHVRGLVRQRAQE